MSWWVLSSEALMEMLQRVAAGENPGIVYTEYYANCDTEEVSRGETPEESDT